MIKTLGVLYAVFLGVSSTNSQQQYNNIATQVNKEAYLTAALISFAKNLKEPLRTQIRYSVRHYLKSVIDDE